MPPKLKYSKQEITELGFRVLRKHGAEALTAREMAKYLNTSSRPIFTAFKSMDEFKASVINQCEQLFEQFCSNEIQSGRYPQYKALGMAYIRLAKEEPNVFKLLFMRDTTNEISTSDLGFKEAVSLVHNQTGLPQDASEKLHLEVWTFVHGVAVMSATAYLTLSEEEISQCLTDVYQGLKWRHFDGKNN